MVFAHDISRYDGVSQGGDSPDAGPAIVRRAFGRSRCYATPDPQVARGYVKGDPESVITGLSIISAKARTSDIVYRRRVDLVERSGDLVGMEAAALIVLAN